MAELQLRELTPAFGTEITGLDPQAALSDEATQAELRTLFDARGVLVFRELEIDACAGIEKRRGPRTQQQRVNVEADLVDHPGLEERRGKIAAAHHDDVLARLRLELADELARVGRDELGLLVGERCEATREDVALHVRHRRIVRARV